MDEDDEDDYQLELEGELNSLDLGADDGMPEERKRLKYMKMLVCVSPFHSQFFPCDLGLQLVWYCACVCWST